MTETSMVAATKCMIYRYEQKQQIFSIIKTKVLNENTIAYRFEDK